MSVVSTYVVALNRTHVSYVTNIRFGVNEKAGRRDFKILDFLSRDRICPSHPTGDEMIIAFDQHHSGFKIFHLQYQS